MKTINIFLKQKLKEKNMRVDTFIAKCNFSKSTIYRVMKGYQKPSEDLIQKMCSILNLNDIEERELRYYSSLLDTEDDTLSAHQEIFNLIYAPLNPATDKIELVYYAEKKYIRTLNEILDELLAISDLDNFKCTFRLINCCKDTIIHTLYDTFFILMNTKKTYSVEHLINFSTNNLKDNIIILNETIPLLSLDNYKILYSETECPCNNAIFPNLMLLDYEYLDSHNLHQQKHLYISYLDESLSACLVVEDENIQDFFERNYTVMQRNYKQALNNEKKYEFIGNLILELESKYDICLFKPNPCYNRIPLPVYESLKNRISQEAMEDFLKSFMCGNIAQETMEDQVNDLLDYMGTRIDVSHTKKQLDIMSKYGLENFAASGRLSDHLEGFPSFSRQEVKLVLEYLKKRDSDEKDSYQFFILKDAYSNEDLLITGFKNYGLLIEYNNPKQKGNTIPYCIIKHEGLGNIFYDFGENYVPTMLALSQKEAHDFIDGLIQKYCDA